MSRSQSSTRWLQEHFSDFYVKKARLEHYRSRAVYKLEEIDRKEQLIRPGMTIVDLGAAPGSWAQYVIKKLNGHGRLIALDILPMDPLPEVCFIQGDFREQDVLQQLFHLIDPYPMDSVAPLDVMKKVDLILSDMAPNRSGIPAVDIPQAIYLAELAFDFTSHSLKCGGNLLLKVFHGSGFDELLRFARTRFNKVTILKPMASRARSREIYLLAKGYRL